MNDNWEVKKLIDVCNIQYGYAFDSSCFCDDNSYPQLIRIRDVVRGYSETFYKGNIPDGYFVDKGDYLIGMDGEFHIAPWQSERALLNQRVCKISASDNNVAERFVYYKMSVVLKQIEDETPFVTVKHLSAKRLNQIKIPIPPLPEQSRIVEELDLLSNIIEKKRQQLSELDNLAQSIFYEMFGDPVTNEKGWDTRDFSKCYKLSSGDGLSAKNIIIGDFPVYGGNGIVGYHIDYNMDGEYIIIGRVGALCGNVRNVIGKAFITDNAFILSKNVENVNVYLMYLLKIHNLRQYAREAMQPVISNTSLKNLRIILPPLNLQQLFAQKIEAIEKQKVLIKQSIAETEELFNSRMDYYFS